MTAPSQEETEKTDDIVQNNEVENSPETTNEETEEKTVPLKAMLKERKKRQEYELRLQQLEAQQSQNSQPEEDDSIYETVTKGDLKQYGDMSKAEIIRAIREEDWKKQNPDMIEFVDHEIGELLKEKPHLAYAISNATNRYEEALDQLRGHGRLKEKSQPEKSKEIKAPGSPSNLPRSAGVNQTVDVMNMTDKEFNEYRRKRIRRR